MTQTSRRDRIRAKILAQCIVDPETGCLLWQGGTSGDGRGGGYGRVRVDGGTVATHIAMWVCEHGIIPPKKQLDHLEVCRGRRNCCNDKHLELVTHKQNQKRRDARRKAAGLHPVSVPSPALKTGASAPTLQALQP